MITIQLRLYEELNRILAPQEQKRSVYRMLPAGSSLRDLVGSLGLGLEEIDLALVNSGPAPLDQLLQDGDRVSLYPEFESMDISGVCLLRSSPLRNTKFVAEASLSELATILREQGYDCSCPDHAEAYDLARISRKQKRILLTLSSGLAQDLALQRCICLQNTHPRKQLEELRLKLQLR